jgi:hypothetical protein
VTDANGAYSFSGLTLPVRIEFTGLQNSDFAASVGSGKNSSIQFYTAATTSANFAVNYPGYYCNTPNPYLATPCYANGDPLLPGAASTDLVLVKAPYDASGVAGSGGTPYVGLGTGSQVGAVWGLAYQKSTKQLFSSAFLKRHVGFGPLGIGGIYKTDMVTNVTTNFVDLSAIGINLGTNPHSGLSGNPTIHRMMKTVIRRSVKSVSAELIFLMMVNSCL